jgi:asparagine synthase (glutamine-hydrolysing)
MCGIFGVVGRDLPDAALAKVFKALEHRGPDGKGLFTDKTHQVTIAHTRLAVIDLETGAQPLQSDNGAILLAANGEIYDFERIRSSLEAQGHRFSTRSDSEVILHLYRQYGLGCFEHLRGEFAFLLYDRVRRLFIAARDRFGIKPLYFSRLPEGFAFASEMKALFASGLVTPTLNIAGLDPLLDQDGNAERFPFEGIEHVAPGSYLLIDLYTFDSKVTRYWTPDIPALAADPVYKPLGDAPAAWARSVLEEVETAVRLRLRADVPVGLYLSGGIDSAFVGALMKRNLHSNLHSFSISFEGSERNEREFARSAAQFLGTEHHELAVSKGMLWENLEKALWFSELPFVSLAPVGKYLLSEEAKKRVTVVLTGEGADEVFLGYRRFFETAIRDTRAQNSKTRFSSPRFRRLKLGAFAGAAALKLSLLAFHKRHRPALAAARAQAFVKADTTKPLINAVQESRIAAMPTDILCYLGDREEMAHSLEARLPFLDHKLFDSAKWIPVDFKFRDGVEKTVLRDAANGLLPDELRLRRKQGFMLTSDAVDFFGGDREATEQLRCRYLSREAFNAAQVYSYSAYRFARWLARVPVWGGVLKRLRRNSNKLIMYMMQTHMLHRMFVADPVWNRWGPEAVTPEPVENPEYALSP